MKQLLSIFIVVLVAITAFGQSSPPNKLRSNDSFTQVDNYLVAAKRLGIPSGPTPTLDASTTSENSTKLFYDTDDGLLMAYNVSTSTWSPVSADVDLTNYYTRAQVDSAITAEISGIPTPTLQSVTTAGNSTNTSIVVNSTNASSTGRLYIENSAGGTINDIPRLRFSYGSTNTVATIDPAHTFGKGLTFLTNVNPNIPSQSSSLSTPKFRILASDNQTVENGGDPNTQVAEFYGSVQGRMHSSIGNGSGYAGYFATQDYVDEQGAFNVEDVTQMLYTDKAINVRAFNNTGMDYQEGSIDFGVSRDFTHTMGPYAFKQGVETTASGYFSSAFGIQTIASDLASSAFGQQTTASGSYSSAFGVSTTASGPASSAFGTETTASGDYSAAFGRQTTASGWYSSAFGQLTTASGWYSSAFGESTTASGYASLAFGINTTANEYASLSIGRYSTGGVVETSWTTGSPIFKVGNGTGLGNRSNAYVLYNDGRSEQVKDIEITEIGQGVVIKSPDGTRWRITVDNSGNLTTTAL